MLFIEVDLEIIFQVHFYVYDISPINVWYQHYQYNILVEILWGNKNKADAIFMKPSPSTLNEIDQFRHWDVAF